MKTIVLCFLVFIQALYFVSGQSVATGHVTAEIIGEVVSISNPGSDKEYVTFPQKNKQDSAPLILGELRLNVNQEVIFNTVVTPSSISNRNGKELLIANDGIATLKNEIVVHLKAEPANGQPSGFYKGFFNVTLAFN